MHPSTSSRPLPGPVAWRRAAVGVVILVGVMAAAGSGPSPVSGALRARALVATAASAAALTSAWDWPLSPPREVTRGFVAPATRYSAGHRGIDLRASPADSVLAPVDGVVSFAGQVAGRPVLSIAHPGNVITSFEPVRAIVSAGDVVPRGAVVGVLASGGHCEADCLHFGVRVDGEYVSPLLYLAGVPRAVLLPAVERVRR